MIQTENFLQNGTKVWRFSLKIYEYANEIFVKKAKNSVSVIKASAYVQRCKIDIFNLD